MNTAIAEQRLRNQYITRAGPDEPEALVAWLGAVQAQEYPLARWGLGLRMRQGTTAAGVEKAFEEGRILRTHVMRPTWHFVAAPDIRWLLALTAPHVHRVMSSYDRRLGLDSAIFNRAMKVFEKALAGRSLTRAELREHLDHAGIATTTITLAHITMHAELEALICSGPRRGKQHTYALVAERAPTARLLPPDEALAELSRRYFTSHGPATIRDFVWWSGVKTADAKRSLEINRARRSDVDGITYWSLGRASVANGPVAHLLPIYDEYLIAYRDREAVPHSTGIGQWRKGVTFQHTVIIGGQVAGTWTTPRSKRGATVKVILQRRLTGAERHAIEEAAARYARFLEEPVTLSIADRNRVSS